MERWSHVEYLVRLRWLQKQWNRPSRTDYQIAKVAQRIIQMAVVKEYRDKITVEDQLVQFIFREKGEEGEASKRLPPLKLMELPSDHPYVLAAKMSWNMRLHGPPKKK